MELSTRIAAWIARKLTKLRGTGRAFTERIGDVFYQAASDGGAQVLVEISAEKFLPAERALPEGSHDELVRLGFNRPEPSMPNWWILIEDGQEEDFLAAATATTTALLEVFGLDVDDLAAAAGLPAATPKPSPAQPSRPASGEGEPLVVDGSLGEVRLYPNGFATLDGEPWSDEPVREWAVNSDGQIGITLEPAGDKSFPHVAIVENSEQAASVLRRFAPSRDDSRVLAHRLAVAEYYPLTAILTGTIYHYDLARAVRDLEHEYRDYPAGSVEGWPFAKRLATAVEAASDLYWTQSADNNRELRSDEQATWETIQKWVRISPWSDDFDFKILPAERLPFHIAPGPELQIQRVYPGAPTVEPWALVLRDLEINSIHSTLTVRRGVDGTVRFEAQDLGVPSGLVSNDTEYEYFRTVQSRYVPRLVELLGGRPGDDLRDLLKAKWSGDNSFELEKRLGGADFPVELFSC